MFTDNLVGNLQRHTVPAVVFAVILMFGLLTIFLLRVFDHTSTALNAFILIITFLTGIYLGYLAFNTA